MKLSVLMTVFNEKDFVDYSIRCCMPYVDNLVIVEGAYQESIAVGAKPRSNDGTCEIIKKYIDNEKIFLIEANEKSDKDQRNVGLNKIKQLNPDGFLLIVDGDEVYDPQTFLIIKSIAKLMHSKGQYAAYFQSLTFVNDFQHYCLQKFPRLFRITKDCKFVNDNYMIWPDENVVQWKYPEIIELLNIKYIHYGFCKGNRFKLKELWWQTRFDKPFDYSWKMDENGKISDPNHKIYEFKGKHPQIMDEYFLKKGIKNV